MSNGMMNNVKKYLIRTDGCAKMKRIEKKNALMKRIETTYGEEIEEILRYMYVDKEYSLAHIGRTLHISYVTVVRWLRLTGLHHRHIDLGD